MSNLDFEDLDLFLLHKKGRIIHQIWFQKILSKRKAAKLYDSLKMYRDSWKIKNPDWFHIEWNNEMCDKLISNFYKEYWSLYRSYIYEIQRCDVARCFILHRYGGLYADMDYYCNKPMNKAFLKYNKNFYLVSTPNNGGNYVSNSLMYSKPKHVFWRRLLIEMEKSTKFPIYYSRHMMVMYSTGPGVLTRVYNKYKIKYKLHSFPSKLFHPYGIKDDILSLKNSNAYAIHVGKGSWEKNDSKILILLYLNYKMVLFILLFLIINVLIIYLTK